jgi:O-antigen ligase
MFLSISRGVMFWQTGEHRTFEEMAAGSPLERSILIALIGLGLLVLLRRRNQAGSLVRNNRVVIALYLFMGISVIWSDYTFISFKRYIKAVGTLVMVYVILSDSRPLRSLNLALFHFLWFTLGLSLIMIVLFPQAGRTSAFSGGAVWVGISYTKNNLGQLSLLGSIFFIWRFTQLETPWKKTLNTALLLLSLLLLFGSRSMTSIALFLFLAFILLLFIVFRRTIREIWAVFLLAGGMAVLILVLLGDLVLRVPVFDYLISLTGRDVTFTGRTELWAELARYAARNPVLGYGYSGFWAGMFGQELWSQFVWKPNQAHNGYIDVFLQLGILGFILFMVFAVRALFVSIRRFSMDWYFGALSFIIVLAVMLNNLMESSFVRLNHLYWFMLLLFGNRTFFENSAAGSGTPDRPGAP